MNIFGISANVTVDVSILYFCQKTTKLHQEVLSDQGNRFYFVFSVTTYYRND